MPTVLRNHILHYKVKSAYMKQKGSSQTTPCCLDLKVLLLQPWSISVLLQHLKCCLCLSANWYFSRHPIIPASTNAAAITTLTFSSQSTKDEGRSFHSDEVSQAPNNLVLEQFPFCSAVNTYLNSVLLLFKTKKMLVLAHKAEAIPTPRTMEIPTRRCWYSVPVGWVCVSVKCHQVTSNLRRPYESMTSKISLPALIRSCLLKAILCCIFLLPSTFPRINTFSSEFCLPIRWSPG